MSFLAPLFFAMGAAAGLPILFHLLRQRPQQTVLFSSLMFLRPFPPRLTRRKRIDDWFLMLLRILAILAIATAFTRPFIKSQSVLVSEQTSRMVVFLLDRSASMQREGVWESAVGILNEELDGLLPHDRAAVIAYDRLPEIVIGPTTQANLSLDSRGLNTKTASLFRSLRPTWGRGDLGAALVMAAGVIEQSTEKEGGRTSDKRVVIIGDLQATSDLAALRGFAWPQSITAELRKIEGKYPTNASLRLLAPSSQEDAANADQFRLWITNSRKADRGQFQWHWVRANEGTVKENPIDVHSGPFTVSVPAGTTKIIPIDPPPPDAIAVELRGDDNPYDNLFWVTGSVPETHRVLYLGKRITDPRDDPYYFLQRVRLESPTRKVQYDQIAPGDPLERRQLLGKQTDNSAQPAHVPLVVIHDFDPKWSDVLSDYLQSGGHLLWVLDSMNVGDPQMAEGLRQLSSDDRLQIAPAPEISDRVLAQVDFSHPLFTPLADARFADFSKIQFWKPQSLVLGESPASEANSLAVEPDHGWRILARFDDGSIAIAERSLHNGRVSVIAAGWQPSESQLALSTKFVPLVSGWTFDRNTPTASMQLTIGQIPGGFSDKTAFMLRHGNEKKEELPLLAPGETVSVPGVYQAMVEEGDSAGEPKSLVANLDASESSFEVLEQATLEQYGLSFTSRLRETQEATIERQMRDLELEDQQQWWRALLLLALAILGLETLLGIRRRNQPNFENEIVVPS